MNSRSLWIVLGVTALLAVGLAWMRLSSAPAGNLAGSSLGGAFAMVDQDGRAVTDTDFKGRYRLMYFGYTSCPDVCPTDVAVIVRGFKAFEAKRPDRAARVQPMFITIDPERDTPQALKAFVSAFRPRLIGLTGTSAQVDAMRSAYGIYARKVATSDPDFYLMDHFAVIYLFGPDGRAVAFVPHGATAADVTNLLETYVR